MNRFVRGARVADRNRFLDSFHENDTVTENNMTTHSTSKSGLVDFFGIAGAARKMNERDILSYFAGAYGENRNSAMKLLFWARDVRGGAGERRLFRAVIRWLAANDADALRKNVQFIPEYGRWDDVLELFGTPLESEALRLIASGLQEGHGLCAKWMPRKGAAANKIRAYMRMTPKNYRKGLVELTRVVEQLMCANQFEAIDYGKLPSLAAARYQNAFKRHDPFGYQNYIDSLKRGTDKINAGAVYPYDVIKSMRMGSAEVANEQWKALPDYLEGSEGKNILPVVDVSGSMTAAASGSNVSCMDISISLGMYLAERNRGAFRDHFITFSGKPQMHRLAGDLFARYAQLKCADWGMNTNIEATFALILNHARKYGVPQSDMPTQILILSDMQFDQCTGGQDRYSYYSRNHHDCPEFNPNVVEMARRMYRDAGYELPELVFWNLRAVKDKSPVQITDSGVALVSGFSPAIMRNILAASDIAECQITPYDLMMNVVNDPRYAAIRA